MRRRQTEDGVRAQRTKLAKELSKRSTGRTLYVLDEPSVGLHAADVHKLVEVLQRFVDEGNTVLIIEHNPEIIKVADRLIDLGPEGGDRGGGEDEGELHRAVFEQTCISPSGQRRQNSGLHVPLLTPDEPSTAGKVPLQAL